MLSKLTPTRGVAVPAALTENTTLVRSVNDESKLFSCCASGRSWIGTGNGTVKVRDCVTVEPSAVVPVASTEHDWGS